MVTTRNIEAVPKPIEVGPQMQALRRFYRDCTWEGLPLHLARVAGGQRGDGLDRGGDQRGHQALLPAGRWQRRRGHRLATHCGILGTSFDGEGWVADPPLTDDKGVNPPPGWGNPFEEGTIALLSAGVAEFRGESGMVAQFRLWAPGDPVPPACA